MAPVVATAIMAAAPICPKGRLMRIAFIIVTLAAAASFHTADVAPAPFGNGVVGVADLLMVIANWG